MKKYKIVYNANPAYPNEYDFIGNKEDLTSQEEKEFNTLEEAINFWYKCSSPITQLIEFLEDFKSIYKEYDESILSEMLISPEQREVKKVISTL